jgi:hypothetical protein
MHTRGTHLGLIVRIRSCPNACKRHQNKHLVFDHAYFEGSQGRNLMACFGVAYEPQGRLLVRTMIPRYLVLAQLKDQTFPRRLKYLAQPGEIRAVDREST